MSALKLHKRDPDPNKPQQDPQLPRPDEDTPEPGNHRPAWRRRLIEVERGFSMSLRRESTLYVHFFMLSIVITAGLVLSLSLTEWAVIVLAATVVVSTSMFNMTLTAIRESLREHFAVTCEAPFRMSTAAVFVALTGSVLAVCMILGRRIFVLF